MHVVCDLTLIFLRGFLLSLHALDSTGHFSWWILVVVCFLFSLVLPVVQWPSLYFLYFILQQTDSERAVYFTCSSLMFTGVRALLVAGLASLGHHSRVVSSWSGVLGTKAPLPFSPKWSRITFHLNCVCVGSCCLDLFCTLWNVTGTECSNSSFCSLGVLPLQGRAWVLQGKKIKKMHLMFSVKEWYKCTGRKEQVNRYVQWTRLVYEFLQTLKYQGF